MSRVPAPTRRKTATLGILLGLLLSALDSTLVATALPIILEKLDGFTLYFLPNAAFMLLQTVSMPLWGRFSDLYGRRGFHLAAVAILLAGSAVCGLSTTMALLTAGRAVQGLGAGGVMSLSFIMIADLYPGEQRAKMQGAISSVWGIAALAGPLLGGWLAQSYSWQWIFWINIPIGVAAAAVVQYAWESQPLPGRGKPDLAGAALLALASAAALVGFGAAGREGWSHPLAAGGLGAMAVFAVILVLVERRQPEPFIAYDLFRSRLFAAGAATGVCAMVAMFDAIQHVPLLVVGVLQRTPKTGGLMLACMMVPWMACSGAARPLIKRLGFRGLGVTGLAFAAGAYAVLLSVELSSGLGTVVVAMVLLGTGLGLTVAPLLIAAQNGAPRDRLGAATSLTQFTRSMGSFIFLAIIATLFLAPFGGKEPQGIVDFASKRDPEQLRALVAPLQEGLRHAFHGGLGASLVGILVAFAIPREK